MTSCPDPAELRRWVNHELSGPDETAITRHVASCSSCKRIVEESAETQEETRVRPNHPPASATDLLPHVPVEPRWVDPTNRPPATEADPLPETQAHNSRTEAPEVTRVRAPSAGAVGVLPPPGMAHVPGYEIQGILGRGGMGVVYKARQVALDRPVALKMIRGGAHATEVDRARLRSEAELVARVTHPNIVQIFEVGESDGQPYLALEFVDGGNLASRLAAGLPPPREVATLLATLAGAVQAAHCRNVIHRDLKPANVLLTATGVPKIADFGLARGLDAETRHTLSGEILGTPSFMSPEQATGVLAAVGPSADIYALGAILYVALTGRPPFLAESSVATLVLVCQQEAVPPSRLRPGVPRDLERICLKCLNKRPEDRYFSAADMAEDLNRYLRGEPVTARPVGAVVRAGKWARRRPAVAALVALGLLALAGGLWYNGRLQGARAEIAARGELARSAADAMAPLAEEWLEVEPGQDPAQQEILETALRVYQTLAREQGDDPSLRRATALAEFRRARIYHRLVRPDEAERAFDRAIQLQEELTRQNPGEPAYRQDLANSYNYRGELLRETQHPEEALVWYDRAMGLQTELVSENDRAEYRKEQARSEYNRALALRQLGRLAEALAGFDRAAALLEPAARSNPDEPSYAQELARAYLNRAVVLAEMKRVPDAIETCQRAIKVQRGVTERFSKPEYRYELAVSLFNLGNDLRASGDQQKQAADEECRALLTVLTDRYPGRLAVRLFNLGNDLRASGDQRKQALDAYEESRAVLTVLADQYPRRLYYARQLASTYNGLGAALWASDRAEDRAGAEAVWAESARRFERLSEQNPDLADCHFYAGQAAGNLGWFLLKLHQPRKARPELERAARHLEHPSNQNVEHPASQQTRANVYGNLEKACRRLEDPAGAADAIERFLRLRPATDQVRYWLARSYGRCVPLAADAAARDRYAQRTCELLRSVDPQRYRPDTDRMVNEPPERDDAFDGLRGRPEFVELSARWRAR